LKRQLLGTMVTALLVSVSGVAAAQYDYTTGGTSTANTAASNAIRPVGPATSGFSFGLRVGYGIPFGEAAEGSDLSDTVKGSVPIFLDAGYRGLGIANLYLGVFGTWGPAFLSDTSCPSGASCSAGVLRFGANARYHVAPLDTLDPYLGLGVGYEIVSFSAEASGKTVDGSYKGFEFVELQGGLDYKVTFAVRIGPFANFAIGQYSSGDFQIPNGTGGTTQFSGDIPKTSLHEWLILGVRGQYDL
jgi:opacity protein-like surface antigen